MPLHHLAAEGDLVTDIERPTLPDARHLTTIQAFFKTARFDKDGSASVTFQVPSEEKDKLVAVSTNDGMALNVHIYETAMPEGEDWLASALGMETADDAATVLVKKKGPR